jgi:arylsulfatase A-like enzyme
MTRFAAPSDFDRRTRRADEINKEALKLLDTVKSNGRPFFLFINYMDAHWPYLPPPPYDTLYPGKDETFTLKHYFELLEKVLKQERKIRPEEYRHLISQYDGGIAYLDFHIGNLIDHLKNLGLYENTLIIVTSDHGEAFGERDLFEHGISVYQDLVHIPLIIKYPNSGQKMIVQNFVSVVDILPTVMEVLGDEVPIGCPGRSLTKSSLENEKIVISEEFPKGAAVNWHPRFNKISRAIYSGTFKYISSTSGERELYDLSQDANETNNLSNENDDLALELETMLENWLASVKDEYKSTTKTKMDAETYDRLKSLGYIR